MKRGGIAAVAMLAAACSKGLTEEAPSDAAPDARGSALDAGACLDTLNGYCHDQICAPDWSSALDLGRWCSLANAQQKVNSILATTSPCAGYDVILVQLQTGDVTSNPLEALLYDPGSGALVDVLRTGGGGPSGWLCVGGASPAPAPPASCDYGKPYACP